MNQYQAMIWHFARGMLAMALCASQGACTENNGSDTDGNVDEETIAEDGWGDDDGISSNEETGLADETSADEAGDEAESSTDDNGCLDGSDTNWDGCAEIGNFCLPGDTNIFMSWCFDEALNEYHFIPAAAGGYCQCGFPRFDGIVDGELCDPGNPIIGSPYPSKCSTSQRIVCAIDFLPASRIGCCDAEGYACVFA
jgi:hypothetical protein